MGKCELRGLGSKWLRQSATRNTLEAWATLGRGRLLKLHATAERLGFEMASPVRYEERQKGVVPCIYIFLRDGNRGQG
jgi:hypothetical protein